MNDDQFYWLARLLTHHLGDGHLEAAEELEPVLKEWARERGLDAGGLLAQLKREREKYGDESEWWKIDV